MQEARQVITSGSWAPAADTGAWTDAEELWLASQKVGIRKPLLHALVVWP